MLEKRIILPDKDIMLERLLGVCDHDSLKKKFYPKLLESAGQEMPAMLIALMFTFALDTLKSMPLMVVQLVSQFVNEFVDVLVDNDEVAEETKKLIHETVDEALSE